MLIRRRIGGLGRRILGETDFRIVVVILVEENGEMWEVDSKGIEMMVSVWICAA